MGTRGPHVLVDTTPAKTILVYRNGDAFFVGRRFVLPRRPVATFEALLDQLTERVEVPFGVRRLFTPTSGHPVLELQALRAGGKYVAAGREPFKKLDYIHIDPRKPAKVRRSKEIKPVVHCDMNVPSRWRNLHRTSRHVNVFTNGRLFIPPVKIIIPKFSLMEWNSVLAMIGEKVFPLGGVRKLFTMNGHLLENSKDLQDNHFYVAAGLETFKYFPYWKSSTVPSEVQQKYADIEKCSRGKKKEDAKGKEPHKYDNIPCKGEDSVFYAKEGKKKMLVDHLMQGGTEGDVYKAQTPHTETQGAPEVREDDDVHVEAPADQTPAEIVKEDEEIPHSCPDFESHKEDNSRMSFKKRVPLGHNTKKKASIKNLSENKKVVPFPEKEPYDILEERNTPVLLETPLEIEDQREPPMGQQPQESSLTQSEEPPEEQELLKEPYWRQASQEQTPDKQESFEWPSLGQPFPKQIPDKQESFEWPSLGQPSQEELPDKKESFERPSLGQPSQEELPDKKESFERPSLGQPSQEELPDKKESFEQSSLGQKEMTQGKNTKQQIP
ncbi:doublecortin domain-containing protein 2C isoform X2 [Lutra lutra]|uniref:doublecortin domain-containing protein 2C isoform X2 n=1 Tax=Lutra lutra TaxID=9657 RepID=UPI001FD2F95A|nr:doublecortin domain-containing protein 2C isoform X2 [Lutra lutra]